MNQTKVVFLDKMDENTEKLLMNMCPPEVDLRFRDPTIGKKGELKDADCYFVTVYPTTKEVIDAAPNLKLIQRTGVGVDMVDVEHAKSKNIPISICRGLNSVCVADLALLGMLALYRHIIELDASTKQGKWETLKYKHCSYDMLNKTVGILGAGNIGKLVAQRVIACGSKVVYNDIYRMTPEKEAVFNMKYVSFDELLSTSDIISVHVPLVPETKGIINAEAFAKMKPNAILINTARGPLVDTTALIDALTTKKIAGAYLDVFESMPAKADDPLYQAKCDNLITTPHIAAGTYDNNVRCYSLCMENAANLAKNKELKELF